MAVNRCNLASKIEVHFAFERTAKLLGLSAIHERNNFIKHFDDGYFDTETAEEAGELNTNHASADHRQRFRHFIDA